METPSGQRPIIGITTSQQQQKGSIRLGIPRDYVRAVEMAGGIPLLIPVVDDPQLAGAMVGTIDGLLLAGGVDLDPHRFGEDPIPQLGEVDPERDAIELELTSAALAADLPVLGICRGIQVLNVAAGGTLYQDIVAEVPHSLLHHQKAPRPFACHEVRLEPESALARIYQTEIVRVNSFHHQAVRVVAPALRVAAKAKDAVIEGIESREHAFCVGVQWHPECMVERYPVHRRLFAAFVEAAKACRIRRQQRPQGREAPAAAPLRAAAGSRG